jgi:hypothetical protein
MAGFDDRPAPVLMPCDDRFLRYWNHRSGLGRSSPLHRLSSLAQVTFDVMAILGAARRRPPVRVRLGSSPAHRLLAGAMSHRIGPHRSARPLLAALHLPPTFEQYMRGEQRQAVRRAIRRAAEFPITAEPIAAPDERLRSYCDVRMRRPDGMSRAQAAREVIGQAYDEGTVAYHAKDGAGEPVCVGFALVAGDDAYLWKLISRPHPASSQARYLVHTELVTALIGRRVRRLWADGPLTVPPGSQRFQRILGYECARPVLVQERRRLAWTSS